MLSQIPKSTLLPYTTLFRSSLQLNKEQFDLREMILNAISDFKSQLKEYGNVRLEFLSKEDIFVEADKTRISQVISNLLKDRKSTRLNSSHTVISYAVFCMKK